MSFSLSIVYTCLDIVSMFGYCIKDRYVCLITEYIHGGNLSDHLRSVGKLQEVAALKVAQNVASGMVFLHSKMIVHRDLKPGNVLVRQSNDILVQSLGRDKPKNSVAFTLILVGC